MGKLLYRVDEVENIISLCRSKIYELLISGVLVGHNPNGKGKKGLRITGASIKIYVEKYQIPTEEFNKNR